MSSFELLAELLTPAGGRATGTVVHTDDRWSCALPGRLGRDVPQALYGRSEAERGTPLRELVSFALAREAAIARMRARLPARLPGARSQVAVHRIRPPALRPGIVPRVRASLAAGAVVSMAHTPVESRLRRVLADAEVSVARLLLRPGSGGSVLLLGRREGRPVVLRITPAASGDPSDRHPTVPASLDGNLVPRLVATGTSEGLAWTVETRLPGKRPRRVSRALEREAADFCATLPRSEGPEAPGGDLRRIAAVLPHHAAAVELRAAGVERECRTLPGVVVHGDLWAGNLLVRRGHLSGVVDWDAAHASGIPGVDLLHLVATEERQARRVGIGAEFLSRPWLGPRFTRAGRVYWDALGVAPTERQLHAVGVAWWAGQVASTLTRNPWLAQDAEWVTRNVDGVLAVGSEEDR